MTQDDFNTQFSSLYSEENNDETRKQNLKASVIIGGSAVIGAAVATVAEEYDKTRKVEDRAEEIAETHIKETVDKQSEIANPVLEEKEPQVIEHHYETRTIVKEVVHEVPPQQQTPIEEQSPVHVTQTSDTEQPQPEETDMKVEVISVHHDVNINGYNMDVAVVDINEDRTLFIDVNKDGMSDAFVADVNKNGSIDNNEVFDIRRHQIPMPEQQDSSYPTNSSYPEVPGEMPDYSSDDDITIYDV